MRKLERNESRQLKWIAEIRWVLSALNVEDGVAKFGTTGCKGIGSDRKLLDLNCEAVGNDGIQFGGGTPALNTTGLLSNEPADVRSLFSVKE